MLIWQLADSAFPSGSFAHSAGLESSWQQGLMDADSLPAWIDGQIVQTARGALPFAVAAHRDPEAFPAIDADCDAFINNHIANRASRAQGKSFADTAGRTLATPLLRSFLKSARILGASRSLSDRSPSPGTPGEGGGEGLHGMSPSSPIRDSPTPGAAPTPTLPRSTGRGSNGRAMHLPVVFGVVCKLLDISLEQTARLYLFIALRGWISAAVRLGVIGPMEGQSIQARLLPTAEKWAEASLHASCDDAAQTSPIVDIVVAGHDRLYSRLFQS